MADRFPVAELDYDLPERLIAQKPTAQRGTSRLLVLDRATNCLEDALVGDRPRMLRSGDFLVINDTRVVPARITARRETGGRIDGRLRH